MCNAVRKSRSRQFDIRGDNTEQHHRLANKTHLFLGFCGPLGEKLLGALPHRVCAEGLEVAHGGEEIVGKVLAAFEGQEGWQVVDRNHVHGCALGRCDTVDGRVEGGANVAEREGVVGVAGVTAHIHHHTQCLHANTTVCIRIHTPTRTIKEQGFANAPFCTHQCQGQQVWPGMPHDTMVYVCVCVCVCVRACARACVCVER